MTQQVLADRDRIRWHDHAEHQIVHPSRGVLGVLTEDGIVIVPGSRALWLPAHVPHAHQAYGRTEIHSVMFPSGVNPLGLTRVTPLAVSPLMREAVAALTGGPHRSAERRSRLRAVVLDEIAVADGPVLHLPEPDDDRLVALARIFHDNPGDDRTLAELGRTVGAGERTLTRLFRREFGMGFRQWRNQIRLLHATIALAEGTSVAAVAVQMGYSSTSAFIAVFRAALDRTPGSLRATLSDGEPDRGPPGLDRPR